MVNICNRVPQVTKTIDDKLQEYDVDLKPVTMKKYGDKFLYYPTQVSIPLVATTPDLSSKDYLNISNKPKVEVNTYYESEELVQDPVTGKYKFVKKS